MSRIGRMHITVPAGVTVEYKDSVVTVKGPKGTLTQNIASHAIDVKVEGGVVTVERVRVRVRFATDIDRADALLRSVLTEAIPVDVYV